MNIFLWILQILLAVWSIVGGVYTASNYRIVATTMALGTFPKPFWLALSVVEILFAVGLVLPIVLKEQKKLVPFSAAALAVIWVAGVWLYAPYSGFPGMLWGVVPAIVAAFVAYKRWSKSSAKKEANE